MSNESVSVLVVFRRADYIESCLDALRGQTCAAAEIIVVDNSLDPPFSGGLQARYPFVRWLVQRRNVSYCRALNEAARVAKGEFILCLNDDVRLDAGFIEEALKGFTLGPKIGMVSGKILRGDKVTLDSTGEFLSLFYTARERGYGRKDTGRYDRPGRVFGVTGAAAFYRRQMLEDIRDEDGSYFDPAFGYFYEDLDVAWRGRRRGWSAVYMPQAKAYHVRGGTVRRQGGAGRWPARRFLSDELYLDLIKNRYLTISKNATLGGFLWHLPFVFVYDIAAWIFVALLRPKVCARLLLFFLRRSAAKEENLS